MPVPKQCNCQNGGKCLVTGVCVCGEFEGEQCQKSSTVSRQLIGRLGGGGLFALLLMLSFLVCLGAVAFLAFSMYKKKLLQYKKNEAADSSSVSYHSGGFPSLSFSNPVIEKADNDMQPVEYSLNQLSQPAPPTTSTTTTFSNPVYDLESSMADADTPSTSRVSTTSSPPPSNESHTAPVRPELSSAVIAPRSDLLPAGPKPVIPPRSRERGEDKTKLVFDQVSDV
jgi:hypothetical protein